MKPRAARRIRQSAEGRRAVGRTADRQCPNPAELMNGPGERGTFTSTGNMVRYRRRSVYIEPRNWRNGKILLITGALMAIPRTRAVHYRRTSSRAGDPATGTFTANYRRPDRPPSAAVSKRHYGQQVVEGTDRWAATMRV